MVSLLSEALGVKPDFFFRENNVVMGDIEFRKLKNLASKDEQRIIEEVKDTLSRYLELEEILSIQTMFINPLEGKITSVNSFADVENAVSIVRKAWNLGDDPISNSLELLEDNNIKIVEVNAGESFDGMQTYVNDKIPVIAINTDKVKSADRKRFTALHELAHLLLPIGHLPEKKKETYCHQFAGAFLLPATNAYKELGKGRSKLMIQELAMLKKQYGISIQAIVMRAKDLGIITNTYCSQFFFYLNQMGWKVNEPAEYTGEETSNRFIQLLFRALGEELISTSKAASLNNQSLAEFREKLLLIA
jgi:Zn-dependent peptidase ImmA (M78 family)